MQNAGSHSKSSTHRTQETQLNDSEKASAFLYGGACTLHFTFIYIASVTRLSLRTLNTGGKAQGSNFRQQWQKNSFDRMTRSRALFRWGRGGFCWWPALPVARWTTCIEGGIGYAIDSCWLDLASTICLRL